MRFLQAILLAGLVACAGRPAPPPTRPAGAPPTTTVLILGTYHFANPGLDIARFKTADILTATRQREVEEVVDALVRFRPTRILVEVLPASQGRIDSLLSAYRSGRHTLARDERQQVGFRVATKLGLPRLYAIDSPGRFPMDTLLQYAATKDTAFQSFFRQTIRSVEADADSMQRTQTLRAILLHENDPQRLAMSHAVYLRAAAVGAQDGWAGANLSSAWYERNLRIYANAMKAITPGDRVLIIYGAGHVPILQQLLRDSPGITVGRVSDVL